MYPLLRRGVQLVSDHAFTNTQGVPVDPITSAPVTSVDLAKPGSDSGQPSAGGNEWLVALVAVTVVLFGFGIWAVDYTYRCVVATLAAVEDTNPDLYVRLDPDYDPRSDASVDPLKPVERPNSLLQIEEVPEGQHKPITSKLRTTVAHLRARAGYWSRFRGLAMYVTYGVARGLLFMALPINPDQLLGQFLVQTVIAVLLANLQMGWVHIVISRPSNKRFYQRIPGRRAWVQIAPVALFENLTVFAAFFLPLILIEAFGVWDSFLDNTNAPHTNPRNELCQFIGLTTLPTILAFLVSVPAQAIFIRVSASMLPEEDEAIVPFDRSFGGKVVPAILGGSGRLSIADAWATFDTGARVRYVKTVGKAVLIQGVLGVGAALVVGGEIAGIMASRSS